MTDRLIIRTLHSLKSIPADVWDRLANPPSMSYDPFLSHAFFLALESSGSAIDLTGWTPTHLVAEDDTGAILGILPLYSKTHSKGEYVFDQGWAQGFMMAGGRYYPKLLSAVPFTPVTGRRFLVGDGPDRDEVTNALIEGAVHLVETAGLSSLHINFIEGDVVPALRSHDFLLREDRQFHWEDDGYGDFDGFLQSLQSRKRKSIRRERRVALEAGIEVDWIEGAAITGAHWDAFFEFYLDTGARKWGHPYLTEAFFNRIGETMRDDIVLIMARRDGRHIAGALNMKGSRTLYGRYWGALEHHDFLHFEICYYQAIDYALAHGLSRVEAGAQGEHKLLRGYSPTKTRSAHYISHPGLRRAVEEYLEDETAYQDLHDDSMKRHLPFKRDDQKKD